MGFTVIIAHIEKGNHFITDCWVGYSWFDIPYSGYIHISHIHGNRDFGTGLESISHIEGLCGYLKSLIRNIYYIISQEQFILFFQRSRGPSKYYKFIR